MNELANRKLRLKATKKITTQTTFLLTNGLDQKKQKTDKATSMTTNEYKRTEKPESEDINATRRERKNKNNRKK